MIVPALLKLNAPVARNLLSSAPAIRQRLRMPWLAHAALAALAQLENAPVTALQLRTPKLKDPLALVDSALRMRVAARRLRTADSSPPRPISPPRQLELRTPNKAQFAWQWRMVLGHVDLALALA
ncbi:hypothetical protein MMC28_009760 [Mycoblastus sanguinarius]|nr:hypothetical protein [Mycoblastus sanguinarius]